MIVEALYRDGRKERLLVPIDATLAATVAAARHAYDRAPVKHLKILPEKTRDPAQRPH